MKTQTRQTNKAGRECRTFNVSRFQIVTRDDSDARTIELLRIEYDIKTASGKIIAAGLPHKLASRLFEGR